MACNNPILRFINNKYVETPCRICMGCRIARRTEWSNRLRYECAFQARQFGLGSSFVTVTYSDDGLSELLHEHMIEHLQTFDQGTPFNSYNLWFDDMQLMIKRLRSHIKYHLPELNHRFKYYQVGEYGENDKRCHFHFIFCGLPSDLISTFLRKSWKYGFVKCSPVTNARIRYCLKYMDKQVFGQSAKTMFTDNGLSVPHSVMSKGIGIDYLLNYTDISDGVVNSNGHLVPLNNYYVKKYGIDNSAFQCTSYSKQLLSSSLKGLSLGEYRLSVKKGNEYSMVHTSRLSSSVDGSSLHRFIRINLADEKYISDLAQIAIGGKK